MAGSLPCEVVDIILAKLSPFRHYGYRPALLARHDLKVASQVCVSWHQSAQKRLQSIVTLGTTRDLAHLVSSPTARPEYCRALVACFYDTTLPEDEQLRPPTLAAELHRFPALQYLHVEAHRMDDDLTLSALVASCIKIQSLIIEHASEPVPDDSRYSDSESEDDEVGTNWDLDRYLTHTVADISSLVSQGISNLSSLSHLALIRIDLGKVAPQQHAPSSLQSVAFVLSSMSKEVLMRVLLESNNHLTDLALIHPFQLNKEDIVEAVKPVALQLRHLALTFPWPEDGSPPRLAATTTLLQGAVNGTALLCRNLRSLRSQDPQVDVSLLGDLKHLETLSIAVSNTQALDVQLDQGFPALKHLALDTSHIWYTAWDDFKARWRSRSWELSPLPGMMPINRRELVIWGLLKTSRRREQGCLEEDTSAASK